MKRLLKLAKKKDFFRANKKSGSVSRHAMLKNYSFGGPVRNVFAGFKKQPKKKK